MTQELELQLVEAGEITDAEFNQNMLKDVLILGKTSTNKRVYTQDAMINALPLYEGVSVYINHAEGDRKLEDRFGTMKNIRIADKGIVGDIEVLTAHPMFGVVLEAYANKTAKIGCSHDAVGSGVVETNGITTVNKIIKVKSVDLVTNAATVQNLREAENTELVQLKEQVTSLQTENTKLAEQVAGLTKEVTALKEQQNKWATPISIAVVESADKKEMDIKELSKWLCS